MGHVMELARTSELSIRSYCCQLVCGNVSALISSLTGNCVFLMSDENQCHLLIWNCGCVRM